MEQSPRINHPSTDRDQAWGPQPNRLLGQAELLGPLRMTILPDNLYSRFR